MRRHLCLDLLLCCLQGLLMVLHPHRLRLQVLLLLLLCLPLLLVIIY